MPLEGGTLLEITLKDMARRWTSRRVEVGFFDPDQATIAFYLEYGAPNKNIPPRPFMRLTFADNQKAWVEELAGRLRARESSAEALDQVGRSMRLNLQQYITFSWLYIRNAKRTIRKKGFDFPLVETGRMQGKVTYRVTVVR